MSLVQNKKGIEMTTLIQIFLAVAAVGLIIGVVANVSLRAEEKESELLCKTFNEIRFGTEVEKGPFSFNVAPRACKVIDKKNVPSKDYKDHIAGVQEGAKGEIRDLMARCWWMWLEGIQ